MARIRTIKPGFFKSLTIADLPIPARLTFVGLWTYVDDAGRGLDDSRLVKSELWPLDDDITTRKVDTHLATIADHGLIIRYGFSGRRYLQIVGWKEHQRINRPQESAFPAPFTDQSVNDHGTSSDGSGTEHARVTDAVREERNGREMEHPRESSVSTHAYPPNVEAHLRSLPPLPSPVEDIA